MSFHVFSCFTLVSELLIDISVLLQYNDYNHIHIQIIRDHSREIFVDADAGRAQRCAPPPSTYPGAPGEPPPAPP